MSDFSEALVNTLPDAVAGINTKGIVTHWNIAAQKLFLLTPQQVVGKPIENIIAPGHRSEFLALQKQAKRGHQPQPLVLSFLNGRHKSIDLELKINPVFNTQGKIEGISCCFVNPTSQLRAQAALSQSETKLRGFIENSIDAIVLTDEEGIIVEWNDGAEKISDLAFEDVFGRYIWDVQYSLLAEKNKTPAMKRLIESRYKQFFKTGQGAWVGKLLEETWVGALGNKRRVQSVTFKIKTEKGWLAGSTSRDVTETHQSKAMLANSERVYNTTVNALDDYIYVINNKYEILLANEAFKQIAKQMGLTANPEGQKLTDIYPDLNPTVREVLQNLFTAGEEASFQSEEDILGQQVVTQTRLIPVLDKNNKVVRAVVHIRDITQETSSQNRIKEKEFNYRTLFDNTFEGVFIMDRHSSQIKEANPAALKMYGYSLEEFTQLRNFDISAERTKTLEATRSPRQHVPYRYHKRKDASVFPVEINANPITVMGEEMILVNVRDISLKQMADDAIERERNVFSNGPVVLFKRSTTEGWPVQYVSANVQQFGYTESHFAEGIKTYKDLIYEPDLPLVNQTLHNRLKDGTKNFEQIYRIVNAKGQVRWVYDYTIVVRNRQNAVSHFDGYIFDIHDKKLAEETIMRSEQRFSEMFYRHNAMMIMADPETLEIVEANDSAVRFYQYDHQKLLQTTLPQLSNEPFAELKQKLENVDKKNHVISARHQLGNGELRDVEINSCLIKDQLNDWYFAIITDVTDRNQALEQLEATNQQLKAIFETIPGAVSVIDNQFKISNLSTKLRNLYQLPDNYDPIGQNCFKLKTPLNNLPLYSDVATVIKTGRAESRLTTTAEAKILGNHYKISTAPIFGHEGNIVGAVEILFDVSDLRQTKKALEQSEANFRAILNNSKDIYVLVDKKARLVAFNNRAKQNFKQFHHRDLKLNHSILEQLPPALVNKFEQNFKQALSGKLVQFEYAPNTDNAPNWLQITYSPVFRTDGQIIGVCFIERDISEYKNAMNQLTKARNQAEKNSRAKDEFIATVSHEIRTPLNGMLGLAELVRHQTTNPTAQLQLNTLMDSGKHLINIINDLLDISKIEADQLEIKNNNFDLHQALHQVVRTLKPIALGKGLDLNLIIDDNVPTWVLADGLRIKQILYNLLGNGLKYTQSGYCQLHVKRQTYHNNTPDAQTQMQLGSKPNSQITLLFEVVDTGPGIAPAQQKALFDRYQNLGRTDYNSIGLGLAISKKLAEMMDGHIWLESEMGKGSVFYFEAKVSQAGPTNNPNNTRVTTTPLNVLLIEPEKLSYLALKAYLEALGNRVAHVNTLQEAVRRLHIEQFNLIVIGSDINLNNTTNVNKLKQSLGNKQATMQVLLLDAEHNQKQNQHLAKQLLPEIKANFLSSPVEYQQLTGFVFDLFPQQCFSGGWPTGMVLNIDKTLGRIGNDTEFLTKVYKTFLAAEGSKINELLQAINNKHNHEAADLAHSLKGASLNVGAERLHQVTEEVEKALNQKSYLAAKNLCKILVSEFDKVKEKIYEI